MDMQIALLSQKVKDGSRGSVRVACGVRAIGGGSILQEPLAPYLAGGEEMRNLLGNRARREDARVVENVAVRHRAIDDVILRHCTPARGIRQVVSINGGLDSRAYRLNLPEVSWFDVDLFDVLELKKRLLEKAPEALRAYSIPRVQSVTPVGMDVLADAPHYLRTALEKQGVDFTRPVLYVFEACLYNFEAEKAKTLMRSLPARLRRSSPRTSNAPCSSGCVTHDTRRRRRTSPNSLTTGEAVWKNAPGMERLGESLFYTLYGQLV